MEKKEKWYKRGPALPGLCLFCNNYYPRSNSNFKVGSDKTSSSKVPKHRRCFNFLAARFGVPTPKRKTFDTIKSNPEFSFITEAAPLCLSCHVLLDQVNFLYLKSQSVKFQLDNVVEQIQNLILKSRPKTGHIYTDLDAESESHFNWFRRKVTPQEVQTEQNLNILLPSIKVTKLGQEEIDKYTRLKMVQDIEDDNLNNLQDSDEDYGETCKFLVDEDVDIKPEISEIEIKPSTTRMSKSPLRLTRTRESRKRKAEEENDNEKNSFPKLVSVSSIFNEKPDELKQNLQNEDSQVEINSEQMFLDSEIPCGAQLDLNFDNQKKVSGLQVEPAAASEGPPLIPELLPDSSAPKKIKRTRPIYPKAPDENNCKHCDSVYETQIQLKSHYQQNHPGLFPRKCSEPNCEFQCYLNNVLRKHHMLKHAPEEERQKRKNCVCNICGARFFGNKNLAYHHRTHTGEKPFKCSTCGKAFRQQHTLDVHIFRIHENIRNFACPHCPWKFKDQKSLQGHIAIHTGEKNHSCHICGRRTIHLHALKSHWRVHKKKGDWVEAPLEVTTKKKWVRKKKVALPHTKILPGSLTE